MRGVLGDASFPRSRALKIGVFLKNSYVFFTGTSPRKCGKYIFGIKLDELVYTMYAPETCHLRCISNCKTVAVGVPKTDAANAKLQRGTLAAMVVMQQQQQQQQQRCRIGTAAAACCLTLTLDLKVEMDTKRNKFTIMPSKITLPQTETH